MKKTTLTAMLLLLALSVQTVEAQEFAIVFDKFLSKLVERNPQLETVTIPDMEILEVPGFEGEAMYMIYFNSEEDGSIFNEALRKENIPFFIFKKDETQIGLFYSDIAFFLMMAAIGL